MLLGAVAFVMIRVLASSEYQTVILLAASAIPPLLVPEWLFLGRRQLYWYSAFAFLTRAVPALVTAVLLASGLSLGEATFGYFVGALACAAFFLTQLKSELATSLRRMNVSSVPRVLRQSVQLGLGSLLGVILVSADSLLTRLFLGTQALGIYAAATRPLTGLMTAESLLVQAAFPRAVVAARSSTMRLAKVARSTLLTLLVFVVPLVFLGELYSSEVLSSLFSTDIAAAGSTVMRTYLVAVVLNAFSSAQLTLMVLPQGRDRAYLYCVACAVAAVVVPAPLVIRLYGLTGAAFLAVLGQFVLAIGSRIAGRTI